MPVATLPKYKGQGCLIANREADPAKKPFRLPDDGWWQVASLGEHPGKTDGGDELIQVVDAEALQLMVASFNADSAKPGFAGMLVDYDHFSHFTDQSSEAACWVFEMEARADGLWVKGRWTTDGEEAVTSGTYRFASGVFTGFVWLDSMRGRPTKILRIALTNDPGLKNLDPISVPNRNQVMTMNHKALLLALLGLPDTSPDTEIDTAYNRFKSAHTNIPGVTEKLGTVLNRVSAAESETTSAKNRVTALTAELVEKDVAEFGDAVADKEALKNQLLANRDATIATLRSMKVAGKKPSTAESRANKRPVFNRAQNGGTNPGDVTEEEDAEAQLHASNRATSIGVLARELKIKNRLPLSQAYAMAERQIPA